MVLPNLSRHAIPCSRYHRHPNARLMHHASRLAVCLIFITIFIPLFLSIHVHPSTRRTLRPNLYYLYPYLYSHVSLHSHSSIVPFITHLSLFPHPCICIDIILVHYSSIVVVSNRKAENNISSISLKAWRTPPSKQSSSIKPSSVKKRSFIDLNN